MRIIGSTVGAPPHGISKYLVKIIQNTLKKSQNKLKILLNLSAKQKHGKYPQLKTNYHMMSLTYTHLFPLTKL